MRNAQSARRLDSFRRRIAGPRHAPLGENRQSIDHGQPILPLGYRLWPLGYRRRGAAQVFLEWPLPAVASLARDNEIKAGHKGDQLSAAAGFLARICRNSFATAPALFPVPRRQLPAMRE